MLAKLLHAPTVEANFRQALICVLMFCLHTRKNMLK